VIFFQLSRRWVSALCSIAVSGSAAAGAASTSLPRPPKTAFSKRWVDLSADEQRALLEQVSGADASLRPRLIDISERFLGTPYLASPLGEGSGPDPDPLIRFDAVDCLTFVEETMALALAASWDEVVRVLTQIRYLDQVSYERRNHLMEAQWIPNNARKGFLKSATRRYGGEGAREVWKEITERTWASKSSKSLGLTGNDRPRGKFPLTIVPLDDVPAIAPKLESGIILAVVREDRPYSVTRISHVGFVIQKGSRTYLRHATRTFGRVVDEELRSFLDRNSKYDRWKVVGVSLFEVAQPATGAHTGPAKDAQP
jgi:hypothetical protein